MNVIVALDHRFLCKQDGSIWDTSVFRYSFWERYLKVFSSVTVVARVRDVTHVPEGATMSSGPGVNFIRVPYFVGPLEYLRSRRLAKRVVQAIPMENSAAILRVSSSVSGLVEQVLRREGRPFGLEVVGDPYDAFSPGAIRHPLRPLFRYWFKSQLQRQCRQAAAVAYVTKDALQRRYPADVQAYTTHYSSIELGSDAFVPEPRHWSSAQTQWTIIYVGTLQQLYKAPDLLIAAVADCVRAGMDMRLVLLGDGRHRHYLERLCAECDVADRVVFHGHVTAPEAIREELDQADLFVLPSRTEGLPRAIIEAMARGLPCIGSDAGGIPELLSADCVVPRDDKDALVRKIVQILRDPEKMSALSRRNLSESRKYEESILRDRREKFYRYILDETRGWLECSQES